MSPALRPGPDAVVRFTLHIMGCEGEGMREKIRVGVLFGGQSAEHEPVMQGVAEGEAGTSQPVDVLFPILHGPYGEDGTVQGLMELAGVAYVRSGVLGSAVGMDKDMMKRVFRASGFPQVDHLAVLRSRWRREADVVRQDIEAQFAYPLFVKPANMDSSVGVTRAHAVHSFAIDPQTGELTFLSRQFSVGTCPCYVNVDAAVAGSSVCPSIWGRLSWRPITVPGRKAMLIRALPRLMGGRPCSRGLDQLWAARSHGAASSMGMPSRHPRSMCGMEPWQISGRPPHPATAAQYPDRRRLLRALVERVTRMVPLPVRRLAGARGIHARDREIQDSEAVAVEAVMPAGQSIQLPGLPLPPLVVVVVHRHD